MERNRSTGDLLLPPHPPPFLQIRPGAKRLVDPTVDNQHPCALSHRPPCFHFIINLFLDAVERGAEFGEEGAGDGVSGAGVREG